MDVIRELLNNLKDDDDVWNTIYCNKNIKTLSRIEKESKYSSRPLPAGNLPKSSDDDFDIVTKV